MDGDKLLTLLRLASLEELVEVREQKAKELRLQIWLDKEASVR